jgi:two-component system, NarL family, sensor histidine kinase UhpB
MAALKVLILEDQPDDAELMLLELRRAGFTPSALEAFDEPTYLAALAGNPQVVLADYSLPQFDALRALHLLQESGQDIPFIVVTGRMSEEVAVECMHAGAADYLLKDRLARLGPAVLRALQAQEARSARVRSASALRQTTEQLQAVYDASPLPIITCDVRGRVDSWNEAATLAFGWRAEEVLGQPLPLQSAEGAGDLEELTMPSSLQGVERLRRRRDGRALAVSLWTAPLVDDAGAVRGALVIYVDITQRRELEGALREERARLARELHDSVTQSLYSLSLFAEAGRQQALAGQLPQTQHSLTRIAETAVQALKEMRLLVYELRPEGIEQVGLAAALERRLNAVERRAGVEAHLLADDVPHLEPAVEDGLYRVALEALNNALKHAHASLITVQVRQRGEHVELAVLDNGVGFDVAAGGLAGGLGLTSMRERAAALGGELLIQSAPRQGAVVQLRVPGGQS